MFGSRQHGVHAYNNVGMETGVASASPHKLIVMLYDGALVALKDAARHMKAGHIADKGKAISKSISIIESGLRASLDKGAGGDIAESLDALYEYMSARLVLANLKNEVDILDEVQRLLTELRDAWNAIGVMVGEPPPAAAPATAGAAPAPAPPPSAAAIAAYSFSTASA